MINTRMSSNLLASQIATDLVQKQAELARVQTQISTGKRLNTPADDPSKAAQIITMKEATSKLDQYKRNASIAESQLSLEESTLSAVSNNLQKIRELALSANSGIVDDTTRAAHNAEVKLRLDELFDLANSKDSLGNFTFGGTNSKIPPFTRESGVKYNGSDDVMQTSVGLGRKIQTGDSGIDTFMRIRNGNGTFQTQMQDSNTGSGTIAQGSVINSSLYEPKSYNIVFTASNTFDIVDEETGSNLQTGVPYIDGNDIEFNGIRTSISGAPAAGDSFQVSPSTNQDIFTTVSNFIDALDSSPTTEADKARMQQSINSLIGNLDQSLEHINTVRAQVGTRLKNIDSSREANADIALQIKRSQSEAEDTDIAEAITTLQMQLTSLDVLQKTYSQVQNLSLFNYL